MELMTARMSFVSRIPGQSKDFRNISRQHCVHAAVLICMRTDLAIGLRKGRASQASVPLSQIHMQQHARAGQLQVRGDGEGDIRAGDVCADDQVAWRLYCLQATQPCSTEPQLRECGCN